MHNFAEELTQSKIKQYLEDNNGGLSFIFCSIFHKIQNLKEESKTQSDNLETQIKELVKCVTPIVEQHKQEQNIAKFFTSTRGKIVSWISAVMLLFSFAGMILAWCK